MLEMLRYGRDYWIETYHEWILKHGSPFWILWFVFGPLVRWKHKRLNMLWHYALNCPHCAFDGFDMYYDPWFECTNGGTSSTQAGVVHWFEGIQTCPRCRYKWHVSDSS